MRGESETEQNCNILTSTLLAITAVLSRFPGLLNRGPGAQPFWDMVLIPASSLQLTWTSCCRDYIIIWRPTTSWERYNFALNSTPRPSRSPLISGYLRRPDILISSTGFTQVHFFFWQIGRVGGQYVTVWISIDFPKVNVIVWLGFELSNSFSQNLNSGYWIYFLCWARKTRQHQNLGVVLEVWWLKYGIAASK